MMGEDVREAVGASDLQALAARLLDLLKLRTLPIGMKQYETLEEMEKVHGLRRPRPGRFHTTCQLVTQSRIAGFTLGITAENVRPQSNCGGVMGIDLPSEGTLSGEHMDGVWFENREAAHMHQQGMPRQKYGRYVGTVVSPLRAGRLDPPDIVLFYGTPGQIILFVNGLQWKRYRRYDMSITGESACADSWGRALLTGGDLDLDPVLRRAAIRRRRRRRDADRNAAGRVRAGGRGARTFVPGGPALSDSALRGPHGSLGGHGGKLRLTPFRVAAGERLSCRGGTAPGSDGTGTLPCDPRSEWPILAIGPPRIGGSAHPAAAAVPEVAG